jgi:transposase
MAEHLFDKADYELPTPADVIAESETRTHDPAAVRLRLPVRDQIAFCWEASLNDLIDPDHPVRLVWDLVARLDLSAWLSDVKAVEGRPGRDATDPRILLSLWVYGTLQGIGSARELAELSREHLAYRWLCGGVTVNYHMLSDFRADGGAKLDELHVRIVGSLTASGLVTMNRVAQDGMKTRASAGKSSFRRKPTLERCLDEAREQIETLKRLAEENPNELTVRQRAAQERAARERLARVDDALRQCEKVREQLEATAKKSGRKQKEARASTTDPDARTMKMADGGYRPAMNIQFSTDTQSKIVVGVDVTNDGTDTDQLPPMLDQMEEDHGRTPDEALVDGGYATLETIDESTARGCTVYAPLKDEQKQRDKGVDPHAPKKGDSDAVAAWRTRMGTEAAREIYRLRAQTAEWINAICRNHGLTQLLVRGLAKCRSVALLHVITHNLFQGETLRAQAALATG